MPVRRKSASAADRAGRPLRKALRRVVRPSRDGAAQVQVALADEQSALVVDRQALVDAVRTVLAGEDIASAQISVAIVDDATIHAVNREFLAHDYATDVLSFVLSEPEEPLEGEIVASAETALATARRLGVDPARELLLYVVHGALHLAGYDDVNPASRAVMRRRESYYLEAGDTSGQQARAPAQATRARKSAQRTIRQGAPGVAAT